MNEIEKAYAAGLIDADGSIQISRAASANHRQGFEHALHVELQGINPALPRWLQARWGGNVHVRPRLTSAGNHVWMWSVTSRRARQFLIDICPCLTLKEPQARLALEFQAQCKWRTGGFPRLTEEDLALREGFKAALQYLHKGGDATDGSHND